MKNAINWFAIPAVDFDRACEFYSEILGGEVRVSDVAGEKMGMLPNFDMEEGGVGGHITVDPENASSKGMMVYLNGQPNLQHILDKVEQAGGKIILPKTASPGGFMATFLDSEGNKLAIHNS